jgi:hypothetical protein
MIAESVLTGINVHAVKLEMKKALLLVLTQENAKKQDFR